MARPRFTTAERAAVLRAWAEAQEFGEDQSSFCARQAKALQTRTLRQWVHEAGASARQQVEDETLATMVTLLKQVLASLDDLKSAHAPAGGTPPASTVNASASLAPRSELSSGTTLSTNTGVAATGMPLVSGPPPNAAPQQQPDGRSPARSSSRKFWDD